jgi:hypothetical protein
MNCLISFIIAQFLLTSATFFGPARHLSPDGGGRLRGVPSRRDHQLKDLNEGLWGD